MSLSTLINRPCTILRRTASAAVDDYFNEIPTVTEVPAVVELQQIQRTEPDVEGEFSDTRWLAIFPPDTALTTGDAIVVDGQTYELEGDPWDVRNPRLGAASHVEATVCLTAGAEDA